MKNRPEITEEAKIETAHPDHCGKGFPSRKSVQAMSRTP
jgi:hypothetical protein